jgi:hypothetical protein
MNDRSVRGVTEVCLRGMLSVSAGSFPIEGDGHRAAAGRAAGLSMPYALSKPFEEIALVLAVGAQKADQFGDDAAAP